MFCCLAARILMLNIKEQHTSIAPKGFAYILHTAHDYWQHIAGTYVVEHAITQLFIYFEDFVFVPKRKKNLWGTLFFFVDEVLCGVDLLYVNVFEGWHRVLEVGMNLKNMGGTGSLTLL